MRERFLIFSGGKMELRKGQDIVLAAFKIFARRHPEATLVTASLRAFRISTRTTSLVPSPCRKLDRTRSFFSVAERCFSSTARGVSPGA